MALHSYKAISLKNHPSILSTTNETTYRSTKIPDFATCSQTCTNITSQASPNTTDLANPPCLGFLFTHHAHEEPQCLIYIETTPPTREEVHRLRKGETKARFWTWITLIVLLSPLPTIVRNPGVFIHILEREEDELKIGPYLMYVVFTLMSQSQLIVIPESYADRWYLFVPPEEWRVSRGVLWGLMCAGLVWLSGVARRHVDRRVREVRMAKEGGEVEVEGEGGGWLEKVMEGRVRLE